MAFSYRCVALLLFVLVFGLYERVPTSVAVADHDPLFSVFEKWVSEYGQVYGSVTEKLQRFQVFKSNFQFIESMKNQQGLTYTVGLNKFADLTNKEFLQRYATYKTPRVSSASTPFKYANLTTIPSSIDWSSLGAVTPVKDQGNCGEL